MMINGWLASEVKDLQELLVSPHTIKIRVKLMRTDHTYLDDLSNVFMGGSVAIDSTAAKADRALDINLFDPYKSVQIDPDSPSGSSVYITNMIGVNYVVEDPYGAKSFDIPVFTGPIDKPERNGVFLNLKCLGKDVLGSDAMWFKDSWKKNINKNAIENAILTQYMGEDARHISLPVRRGRTSAPVVLKRFDSRPFATVKSLARSQGDIAFYDGRGVMVQRPIPSKVSFTFNDRLIKTAPQFGYDLTTATNAVEVIGGKPRGSKTRVVVRVVAPYSHPLSPLRLGRNGVPRHINPILVQDDKIKSTREARALALKLLDSGLLEAVDTTFDAMPMPMAEPMDLGLLHYEGYSLKFRMNKFTIPLLNNGSTNIGYLRRQTNKGKPRAIKPKKRK